MTMLTATPQSTHRVGAARFCWGWLTGSAAVSILGVVTHAQLGNARSPLIASVLAFVIVVIQLCATYAVHVFVKAGLVGSAYVWARGGAVAIAFGAFVINFVAQFSLVITWADIPIFIAWIVPLIVDLGMTVSTVALLALANAQRAEQLHAIAHHAAQPAPSVHVEVHNAVHAEAHAAVQPVHATVQPERAAVHAAVAARLTAQGAVRIAPDRVVKVLDAHADGVAPSTIARTLNVGYDTVKTIVGHVEAGCAAA
ncbi:hypothetical protein A5721_22340 [Mycobacterium vulneris]|nr:hypothetical protein A5721_22340 [Mycolicibacterium vulneris]